MVNVNRMVYNDFNCIGSQRNFNFGTCKIHYNDVFILSFSNWWVLKNLYVTNNEFTFKGWIVIIPNDLQQYFKK